MPPLPGRRDRQPECGGSLNRRGVWPPGCRACARRGEAARHRLAAELSQERLAATAGVHRNHLSLIERGKHLPNLALIHRLSSAFGLPMSAMMAQVEAEEGRQDEPPPLPRWRPRKEVKAAGPGGRKRK